MAPQPKMPRAIDRAEARLGPAMERAVASEGFAELLAGIVAVVATIQRSRARVLDQLVRSLRVAGRQDVTRLGRQIARAEDKLERVLQEVEVLQPPSPVQVRTDRVEDLGRWRAGLAGAAVMAAAIGGTLVVLYPPVLPRFEHAVALVVAAVALVALTAWTTLALACRRADKAAR